MARSTYDALSYENLPHALSIEKGGDALMGGLTDTTVGLILFGIIVAAATAVGVDLSLALVSVANQATSWIGTMFAP